MRLEEDLILLDQSCTECAQFLESSLLDMEGIYFTQYDKDKNGILIKFDAKLHDQKIVQRFLEERGFVILGTTPKVSMSPKCCNLEGSSSP